MVCKQNRITPNGIIPTMEYIHPYDLYGEDNEQFTLDAYSATDTYRYFYDLYSDYTVVWTIIGNFWYRKEYDNGKLFRTMTWES